MRRPATTVCRGLARYVESKTFPIPDCWEILIDCGQLTGQHRTRGDDGMFILFRGLYLPLLAPVIRTTVWSSMCGGLAVIEAIVQKNSLGRLKLSRS